MLSFETNLDLLYFSLTILTGCVTILLSLLLIKVISIVSNIQKITESVKETAQLVNEYAWKPIEILMQVKDYVVKHLKK